MYSDLFCKIYNEFGWNYYPEAFGEQLLLWLHQHNIKPANSVDLACGTGILCQILKEHKINSSGMDFSKGMIDIARENNPSIPYVVADMTTWCPVEQYDLVTCTGDALNHISCLSDIEKIFRNVFRYTAPGGYFIFDLLNEHEISDSEPFEMDWVDSQHVWFQMLRPAADKVALTIRVYEQGKLTVEEVIRETIYSPETICRILENCGFQIIKCSDQLPDNTEYHGTTWFLIARKPKEVS